MIPSRPESVFSVFMIATGQLIPKQMIIPASNTLISVSQTAMAVSP